jgi:hypothetical protein
VNGEEERVSASVQKSVEADSVTMAAPAGLLQKRGIVTREEVPARGTVDVARTVRPLAISSGLVRWIFCTTVSTCTSCARPDREPRQTHSGVTAMFEHRNNRRYEARAPS